MINARAKKTAGNICLNLIYALIGAAMLLPIYYLVITTFKTPAEAAASPLGLTEHFTLENYIKALDAIIWSLPAVPWGCCLFFRRWPPM